jgi:hypothetical protein
MQTSCAADLLLHKSLSHKGIAFGTGAKGISFFGGKSHFLPVFCFLATLSRATRKGDWWAALRICPRFSLGNPLSTKRIASGFLPVRSMTDCLAQFQEKGEEATEVLMREDLRLKVPEFSRSCGSFLEETGSGSFIRNSS